MPAGSGTEYAFVRTFTQPRPLTVGKLVCARSAPLAPTAAVLPLASVARRLAVARERGWIEPAELEAFAVENDLPEGEVVVGHVGARRRR